MYHCVLRLTHKREGNSLVNKFLTSGLIDMYTMKYYTLVLFQVSKGTIGEGCWALFHCGYVWATDKWRLFNMIC